MKAMQSHFTTRKGSTKLGFKEKTVILVRNAAQEVRKREESMHARWRR